MHRVSTSTTASSWPQRLDGMRSAPEKRDQTDHTENEKKKRWSLGDGSSEKAMLGRTSAARAAIIEVLTHDLASVIDPPNNAAENRARHVDESETLLIHQEPIVAPVV